MQSRNIRFMSMAGLVAIAYLAVGALSAAMSASTTQAIAVWLASGISFGAWLSGARDHRAAVVTGTVIATIIWGWIGHALPMHAAVAFGLIETGSIVLGAWLLRRTTPVMRG